MLTTLQESCTDPVFLDRVAHNALVWLPEHGMGFLPVDADPYDAGYFDKYRGYAATEMGRRITEARLELVLRHCSSTVTICDVGIGSGDFLDAICGLHGASGCDINPAGIQWLAERGLWLDPYVEQVDALTFWDSLEHIPDVHRMIANVHRWVFCSLPIVPGDGPPRWDWRHFRRDEHCWYFTHQGLLGWMAFQGFYCEEWNTQETQLGRLDINTYVFRRERA